MSTPYNLGINFNVNGRGASSLFGNFGTGFNRASGQALNTTTALGGLRNSIAGLSSQMGSATRALGSFATTGLGGMTSGFSGVTTGLGGITSGLSGVTAAGAGAAASVGLVGAAFAWLFESGIKTNQVLENQTLALTAMVNANLKYRDATGQTLNEEKSFQESLKVSGKLLAKFRFDAARGAGTTSDRLNIASTITNDFLARSGQSLDALPDFVNRTVTVGATVMGGDMAQTARDVARLLRGEAGLDVETANRMRGVIGTQDEWRKLTGPERFQKLQIAFKKYAPDALIKAQAQSWDGLTSTLGDFWDIFSVTIGGQAFGKVKNIFGNLINSIQNADGTYTEFGKNLNNFGLSAGKVFGDTVDGTLQLGRGLIGVWNDYGKPMVAGFQTGFSGFTDLLKPITGFFSSNKKDLADSAQGWKEVASAVGWVVGGFTKFVGLDLAAILGSIAWGAVQIGLGFKSIADAVKERGGGVLGWWRMLSDATEGAGIIIGNTWKWLTDGFNNFRRGVQNGIDGLQISFLSFGRDLMQNARDIPVLGKVLGFVDDQAIGAFTAANNRISDLQMSIAQRNQEATTTGANVTLHQTVNQTNHITTPAEPNKIIGPVAQATAKAAEPDWSKLGVPLILQPR